MQRNWTYPSIHSNQSERTWKESPPQPCPVWTTSSLRPLQRRPRRRSLYAKILVIKGKATNKTFDSVANWPGNRLPKPRIKPNTGGESCVAYFWTRNEKESHTTTFIEISFWIHPPISFRLFCSLSQKGAKNHDTKNVDDVDGGIDDGVISGYCK